MLMCEDGVASAAGTVSITGPIRVRCRQLYHEQLTATAFPGSLEDHVASYAEALEICTLAASRGSVTAYLLAVDRLLMALTTHGAVLVRRYPVHMLPQLSPKRLAAGSAGAQRNADVEARVQRLQATITEEADRSAAAAAEVVVASKMESCRKCGAASHHVQRVSQMLRSGDEGMTNRYLCTKCSATWKTR